MTRSIEECTAPCEIMSFLRVESSFYRIDLTDSQSQEEALIKSQTDLVVQVECLDSEQALHT